MNQLPSLEKLRPLLRMETAVVIAILVLAVAWYTQSQMTEDAREAESAADQKLKTADRKLRAAQQDLDSFDTSNGRGALEAELEKEQSIEQDQLALPSQDKALSFGDALLIYTNDQELHLPVYDQTESVASVGEQEFQAIHYSIRAQGSVAALVGVLKLLQEFPTAAVQTLDFVRPSEELDNCGMSLELDVFFGAGGI